MQKMPNLNAAGVGLFLFLQKSLAGSAGCKALAQVSPDITFQPGSAVYEYEKRNFWSNTREPYVISWSEMKFHKLTLTT